MVKISSRTQYRSDEKKFEITMHDIHQKEKPFHFERVNFQNERVYQINVRSFADGWTCAVLHAGVKDQSIPVTNFTLL